MTQEQEQEKKDNQPSKSFVSHHLIRGMTEEERKQFEGAYLRSKRVLKRQHEFAKREAETTLDLIDNPKKVLSGLPDWKDKALWASGYRNAMKIMMELTRT